MMLAVALVGSTGTVPLRVDTAKADSSVTLLVAASNSLNKNGADYVCDGVNDQVEIQQALDTGEPVMLLAGNFFLSGSLNFSNPIDLRGQGNTTILTFSSDEVVRSATYITGITISELKMVQTVLPAAPSIYMEHDSNITITHCVFDGVCIQIMGGTAPNSPETIDSDNVLVQYCSFLNSPAYTNLFKDWFAVGNSATNFRVLDNYFYNCAGAAIDTVCSPYPIVSGNVIDSAQNNWYSGIESEDGLGVQITNNTIRNCPNGYAIMEQESTYGHGKGGNGTIAQNTITNCRGGIAIMGTSGMTISDNTITDSAWHGIYLDAATVGSAVYHPNNSEVSDNSISGFGLSTDGSAGVTFSDTQLSEFSRNYINGQNYPKAVIGIAERGASDYNTIAGNTILGVPTLISTVGQHTVVTASAPTPTASPSPTSTPIPTPTPASTPTVTPTVTPITPAPTGMSTANAQEFELVPPMIAHVLTKIGVIIDGVLGHWVLGNALTAQGVTLVGSIGQIVVNTTHFLALLVTLF